MDKYDYEYWRRRVDHPYTPEEMFTERLCLRTKEDFEYLKSVIEKRGVHVDMQYRRVLKTSKSKVINWFYKAFNITEVKREAKCTVNYMPINSPA